MYDCVLVSDSNTGEEIGSENFAMSKIELLRSRLKTDIPLKDLESLNEAARLAKHVATVSDQVKHLHSAVGNTIELSKMKGTRISMSEGNFS